MTKSRPILFSPAMSSAILEGRKTQTRRAVRPQSFEKNGQIFTPNEQWVCPYGKKLDSLWVREEYYRFGHWREVAGVRTKMGRQKWAFIPDSAEVLYDAPPSFRKGRHSADPYTATWHKRLARFMPRSVSRINLEITEVRVEKLQSISAADVESEGIERRTIIHQGKKVNGWASSDEWAELKNAKWHPHEVCHHYAPHAYGALWNRINGPESEISWDKNCWVWCLTFKVVS